MAPDSDALAAQGKPITLVDGRVVNLRYSFLALKKIEDKYGTIDQVQTLLSSGKIFSSLADLLTVGLLDVWDPTAVPPVTTLGREPIHLLDTRNLADYSAAFSGALSEALPAAPPGLPTGEEEPSPNGRGVASPGAAATTSAPLSLVAQVTSSGT